MTRMSFGPVMIAVCVGVCGVAPPLSAHHSATMYDSGKTITLRGTVAEVRWTNPHVVVTVTTEAKPGEEPARWTIETTSPGNLTRSGWTRTSLKQNDRVEMTVAPLRDGNHGGLLRQVKLVDTGQILDASNAIRAGETPNLK